MIPYIIQIGRPTDDMKNPTVYVECFSCEINELNEKIIEYIVEFMSDFCGPLMHNIKINSYSDFCNKYWKIGGYELRWYNNIFEILYFNNNWIEWKIDNFHDKIFEAYIHKYSDFNM